MAWGALAGYAINPARDFGPRVASSITGYGVGAFKDQFGEWYFWVPIVGPIIGGVIGGFLYDLLVGRYLPVPEEGAGRLPEEAPPPRPTSA
jgi:glycerol uptake facilitator protein